MIRFQQTNSQDCVSTSSGDAAAAAPSAACRPPAEGAALPFSVPLMLSDQAMTLLAVVAAHDRISAAEFLTRAICARAEAIGIANLTLQGGEEASRLAHNQEVARSNRAPATSHNRESDDHGGGGNPAAPAGVSAADGDAARAPP